MIHYTSINVDTYVSKDQNTTPHKNGLNFFLLLIALITAVAFAVLLFMMIKNKSEEKIILPKEPTVQEDIIPTKTPPANLSVSPTLVPEDILPPQEMNNP
ncbi:MAG TPA: hypothetical protein VJB63_02395 [Patescibacteria group bacterium]|nr:hypothetical protein [Patescibacteria group bacterium]